MSANYDDEDDDASPADADVSKSDQIRQLQHQLKLANRQLYRQRVEQEQIVVQSNRSLETLRRNAESVADKTEALAREVRLLARSMRVAPEENEEDLRPKNVRHYRLLKNEMRAITVYDVPESEYVVMRQSAPRIAFHPALVDAAFVDPRRPGELLLCNDIARQFVFLCLPKTFKEKRRAGARGDIQVGIRIA